MPILTNIRWRTLLSLTIILSIGLLYSHYRHSIWWLNQEVGGIFYEIFWCLFAFLLIPTRRAVWQIPLGIGNYLPVRIYAIVEPTISQLGAFILVGKNVNWYCLYLGRFSLLFYW